MNVAFIPVRGGSKSIPLKNIKKIAGKPLVYWVLRAANKCRYIDKVFVSTDSEIIKETVESFLLEKVTVIGRSEESASDTASTEFAMLEFANKYVFDNIALIQATSPLLKTEDLEEGFKLFFEKETDSVLSVVKQKRFIWTINTQGNANAQNYDIFARPRRQDFDGYYVENGAFYITSRESLLRTKNRISGNIKCVEMDESTYFEIDEPSDWKIIEKQLLQREESECGNRIPEIKMFLTDCDGCLTDGGMYYSENGDEIKKFNAVDGLGMRLLKERGIITGIITGEVRELNRRRANKLKVDIYEMGIDNKAEVVCELCKKHKISLQNVAYVGDDINDLEVIKMVGFGCAVSNADVEVKECAKYVTELSGGQGAVREIINLILKSTC